MTKYLAFDLDAPRLSLDFETRSEVDLPKCGLDRYAKHSSTKALLLAYSFNGEEPEVLDLINGDKIPKDVLDALTDPKIVKQAWNSNFERTIFKHVLGIDIPNEQWFDTQVLAHYLSFPSSLDQAGKAIGLSEDKKKLAAGKALIRTFSMPRKPTIKIKRKWNTEITHPEKWELFKEYCRQDVVTEWAIFRKLRHYMPPDMERGFWLLDQRINQKGVPVNMNAVTKARQKTEEIVTHKLERLKEVTGLENPNSQQQMLEWLRERGYKYYDLKKGHVEREFKRFTDAGNLRMAEVLDLRMETARVSVKKYDAYHRSAVDGLVRYTLKFGGAQRTNRFAGQLIQMQNMARPTKEFEKIQELVSRHIETLDTESFELMYERSMDALSTGIRTMVQAQPGYAFCDADLSAIENRVVGWLAGENKILDVFRAKKDTYVDFATYMFGLSYDEIKAEVDAGDKTKRNLAKPAVLGAAYRLSAGEAKEDPRTGEIVATGLLGYAWNMGVKMTQEEAEHAVNVFRKTYRKVVQMWYDLDDAMKEVIRTGKTVRVGKIVLDLKGPFMRAKLPSGRHIHYFRPKIENRRTPWGDIKPNVTYEGYNDKKMWTRISTHGGKLVENLVQAISRDLLLHGMVLADKKGLDIRLHIHDQVVTMEKEKKALEQLDTLIECMATVPEWGTGLILGAEGHVGKVLIKD